MLLPEEWVGAETPLQLPPQSVLISAASPLEVAQGTNGGRALEGGAVVVRQARLGLLGCIVVGELGAWHVPWMVVGRLPPIAQGWLRWLLICFV